MWLNDAISSRDNLSRLVVGKQICDEKEIHFNARAKNCLFESFSMDVFNQVFTLNTAHEIWLKLQELHDGTTNVYEQNIV